MPTAYSDSLQTTINTAVRIAVLANDSGSQLRIASFTPPASGTAVLNTDQTFTYTPKAGFIGTDSFSYTVRDGSGARATAKVTVQIVNRPPTAVADSAATKANRPVVVNVLANDTDPDGHTLRLVGVGPAANGTPTANADGTVTYTPRQGFVGTDAFTYTASDGFGGTAQATASVAVSGVGEPFSDGTWWTDGTGWI